MTALWAQWLHILAWLGLVMSVISDLLIGLWVYWVWDHLGTTLPLPADWEVDPKVSTRMYAQAHIGVVLLIVAGVYGVFIGGPIALAASAEPMAITDTFVSLYFVLWGIAVGLLVQPLIFSYQVFQRKNVAEFRKLQRQRPIALRSRVGEDEV